MISQREVMRGFFSLARWVLMAWLVLAAALAILIAIDRSNEAQAGSLHSVAMGYQGLHERKNNGTLRRLLGVNPARTPWCGAFVGSVAKRAGRKPPRGHLSARSWLRFGKPVKLSQARRGDVVVMGGRRNHVGIFHGRSKGRVCLIGGNQSNRVKVSCYRTGRVRGVRR